MMPNSEYLNESSPAPALQIAAIGEKLTELTKKLEGLAELPAKLESLDRGHGSLGQEIEACQKKIEELAVFAATRAAKAEVEEAARKVTMTPEEISHVVAEAVRQTLIQMGIDVSDPLAMQQDFQHLRAWRESGEEIKKKGTLAVVGIFLSGLGTLLFLGLREFFQLK